MWAAYVWVLRFDLSLVPVAGGTFAASEAVTRGLEAAYPGALAGSVVAVVLVGVMAIFWHRSLVSP
jgi:hypothetical protein